MEQGLISLKLGAWFGHEEMRCIVWRCDHLGHLIYLRLSEIEMTSPTSNLSILSLLCPIRIQIIHLILVPEVLWVDFFRYAALGCHRLECTGG